MKKIILWIACIFISLNVSAGSWNYVSPGDVLKYNYFNDRYSYESPNSILKYNYFEDTWSYEKPDSYLLYNYYRDGLLLY